MDGVGQALMLVWCQQKGVPSILALLKSLEGYSACGVMGCSHHPAEEPQQLGVVTQVLEEGDRVTQIFRAGRGDPVLAKPHETANFSSVFDLPKGGRS